MVEELDDDGAEKLLFEWESEDGRELGTAAAVVVAVVAGDSDDNEAAEVKFDGIECFSGTAVNEDALTSGSIGRKKQATFSGTGSSGALINREIFLVLWTIRRTHTDVPICCYLIQYLLKLRFCCLHSC